MPTNTCIDVSASVFLSLTIRWYKFKENKMVLANRLVGIFFFGIAAYFIYRIFTSGFTNPTFALYLSIASFTAAVGLFFVFRRFRKPN